MPIIHTYLYNKIDRITRKDVFSEQKKDNVKSFFYQRSAESREIPIKITANKDNIIFYLSICIYTHRGQSKIHTFIQNK
jgi:hypothetical protein